MPQDASDAILRSIPPLVEWDGKIWLPASMQKYAAWIREQLIIILLKRLVHGGAESLIEDVFKIYTAGYFPYGWSGSFPDGIILLVFDGTAS